MSNYKLSIPDVPPSLNKTTRQNGFANWRLKQKWILLIRSQILPPPGIRQSREQMRITLHHSRLYDKDNAYGACKPVVDALKHWGLIWDDRAEWLELTVEQAKCPHKRRHTVIEIGPAPEAGKQ